MQYRRDRVGTWCVPRARHSGILIDACTRLFGTGNLLYFATVQDVEGLLTDYD